jgi:hypothetical protein
MHPIVMSILEAAMDTAGDGEQKATVIQLANQVANTMWQEMPHEWIAFVSSILKFNMGKKTLTGATPIVNNELLLTVMNYFDCDAEADKFLGRRAAYALHLFTQTCSGDERLVEHEYGLAPFHLQAHQESLAKADMRLGTKVEWVLFWSSLIQSVDDVLQDTPMQGLMLWKCGPTSPHYSCNHSTPGHCISKFTEILLTTYLQHLVFNYVLEMLVVLLRLLGVFVLCMIPAYSQVVLTMSLLPRLLWRSSRSMSMVAARAAIPRQLRSLLVSMSSTLRQLQQQLRMILRHKVSLSVQQLGPGCSPRT